MYYKFRRSCDTFRRERTHDKSQFVTITEDNRSFAKTYFLIGLKYQSGLVFKMNFHQNSESTTAN